MKKSKKRKIPLPFDGIDTSIKTIEFPPTDLMPFLSEDKWVWVAWGWSPYGENVKIVSDRPDVDLLKCRCPQCGSRDIAILEEEDVVLVIRRSCGRRTASSKRQLLEDGVCQ